jgi:transcriptional regulator with XRE-family HTH domain
VTLTQFLATLSTARERYTACAERGLTQAETSRELGVSRTAVAAVAKRHRIKFSPFKPTGRVQSKACRKKIAASVKRSWQTRKRGVFEYLTEQQAADYRVLMRHSYKSAEALRAIGRADLIPEAGA